MRHSHVVNVSVLIQTTLAERLCLRPQCSHGDHQVINTKGAKKKKKKKISENYLNHSISILSDNYHLSIEEEAEMKGEYHWSHECSTVITSGIFTAPPHFLSSSFSPPFPSARGEEKRNQCRMVKLQASEPAHKRFGARIWTALEGGRLWGIKRKGSFHAGRSLDSLLCRGCRGPIGLPVDPFGTLDCRWPGCGRRQAPLSALISI